MAGVVIGVACGEKDTHCDAAANEAVEAVRPSMRARLEGLRLLLLWPKASSVLFPDSAWTAPSFAML